MKTPHQKIYEVPTWKPQRISNMRSFVLLFVLLNVYGKRLGSVVQRRFVEYCDCCDEPMYVCYPNAGFASRPVFYAYISGMRLGTIYNYIQDAQKAVEEFLQVSCKMIKKIEPEMVR
jgi:hypothetical protein